MMFIRTTPRYGWEQPIRRVTSSNTWNSLTAERSQKPPRSKPSSKVRCNVEVGAFGMPKRTLHFQVDEDVLLRLNQVAEDLLMNRSELLRRGVLALISAHEQAVADREFVTAYQRAPQDAAFIQALQRAALDAIPDW